MYHIIGTPQNKDEGLKMIKRSADLSDTFARIEYNELTTGQSDPKAEAHFAFQYCKDNVAGAMICYFINSFFGYDTDRDLMTAIH
jgi:uncharacterized protein YtpQ (UPF0354 family)